MDELVTEEFLLTVLGSGVDPSARLHSPGEGAVSYAPEAKVTVKLGSLEATGKHLCVHPKSDSQSSRCRTLSSFSSTMSACKPSCPAMMIMDQTSETAKSGAFEHPTERPPDCQAKFGAFWNLTEGPPDCQAKFGAFWNLTEGPPDCQAKSGTFENLTEGPPDCQAKSGTFENPTEGLPDCQAKSGTEGRRTGGAILAFVIVDQQAVIHFPLILLLGVGKRFLKMERGETDLTKTIELTHKAQGWRVNPHIRKSPLKGPLSRGFIFLWKYTAAAASAHRGKFARLLTVHHSDVPHDRQFQRLLLQRHCDDTLGNANFGFIYLPAEIF
ncbi:hypothetical protein U0070_004710 [Myodes glareolus]|uniref:Uncharacterized protein n=1 Tax=Myodes glareolus TaxID=447135 RepID=A0AAW0IA33_MYOGA